MVDGQPASPAELSGHLTGCPIPDDCAAHALWLLDEAEAHGR